MNSVIVELLGSNACLQDDASPSIPKRHAFIYSWANRHFGVGSIIQGTLSKKKRHNMSWDTYMSNLQGSLAV